jgi:hypothetical protein
MPALGDTGKPVVLPRAPFRVGPPAANAPTGLPGSARTYGATQAPQLKGAPSQLPGAGRSVSNTVAATKAVLNHQPPAQKAAIIRGVAAGRADPVTTRAVKEAIGEWMSKPVGSSLPATVQHAIRQLNLGQSKGGGLASAVVSALPLADIAAHEFGHPLQTLKNAGSDIYNLPATTVEGLYSVGKDIVTGHEGNAVKALVDPYVQLAEHPGQTIGQHPVNSLLMLLGGKAAIGRAAGGAARAGLLGDAAKSAASTVREPLSLGTIAGEPSPITEARSYSPDLITKSMQKAREAYLRKRGINPNIARPAPKYLHPSLAHAFNIGAEAKLNRRVDEMTAVRQMAGRAERGQALDAVRKTAPPKEVRNVVTHILQGVVRKPETAVADITHEINRLKAAQTGKRTVQEIWNRRQVKDLSTALQHPELLPKAFEAAAAIRPALKAQDAYLVAKGLLDQEQAARRAVLPYAMTHMGATHDPVMDRFVSASGAPLSTQEIFDHLKANGVPDPAYIAHLPGKVSPAHFYQAYKLARGSLTRHGLTGRAFKNGHYDHTYEGLAGQVASRAEAVTKASLHDKVVNQLGIKMPKAQQADLIRKVFADARAGKRTIESARNEAALIRRGLFTRDEANRFARSALVDDHGNPIPNATELTPISVAPAHVLNEVKDLQHPNELNNISGIELKALSNAIEDAQHSTARNVTLIPSVAAQRFGQQFARTDSMLRSIGRVTQQFRRTVLPYSTHWMTQIGSEAALRGMLAGTLDPRYLRDGRALMKRLQTSEEGRAALMEMVNATFYNSRDPLAVFNPNQGPVTAAVHAFPPTRALIAAHNRYADTVGHAMYTLEHNARVMGLGKLAHQEIQSFGFSWQNAVKLQGQALDQLATRLKSDPTLVAKFGRQIDDTFGKYNKFSPRVRSAVQSIAPFLPWYLNAAKYVLWTLPAHHPVASALLASLRQTINQDVADGKQAPLNVYAMQELARISPFGIFSPSSTTPSLAGLVEGQQLAPGAFLPEVEGSLYNYAGVNSFGEGPLKSPTGDVKAKSSQALAAALNNLLESFLPAARYVRLAEEGGKPAYGTSTVLSPQPEQGKGQTVVANRIFNPFYSFERAQGATSSPAFGAPSGSAGSSGGYLLGGTSSGGGGYLLGGQSSSGSGGYLLP